MKTATQEERYSLVWRLVLTFVDAKEINLDKIIEAVSEARVRARMRSFGLRIARLLLESVSLSSVRREILHFVLPVCLKILKNRDFTSLFFVQSLHQTQKFGLIQFLCS